MKAKKLTHENIYFINKCCDNHMFQCDKCPYKFSKIYKTTSNTELQCVCDLKNISFPFDFESIEEMIELLNELGNEEIGDII